MNKLLGVLIASTLAAGAFAAEAAAPVTTKDAVTTEAGAATATPAASAPTPHGHKKLHRMKTDAKTGAAPVDAAASATGK